MTSIQRKQITDKYVMLRENYGVRDSIRYTANELGWHIREVAEVLGFLSLMGF